MPKGSSGRISIYRHTHVRLLYYFLYSIRFASINSAATAISGSVAFAAPALMSNTWFPPEQRATATAIGTFFVFMGVGMSFILGESNIYCNFYFFQIIGKIQTFVFFITKEQQTISVLRAAFDLELISHY